MSEKLNPEELLREGQAIRFSPTGYSMYPFLNPDKGDQVIVEPAEGRKIRRGDVVLYRRDGEKTIVDPNGDQCGILVLHRVARCKDGRYYMVGDNQNRLEGPLRRDQIFGIMMARCRGKKVLNASNLLYRMSAAVWLFVCPIRPRIAKCAAILLGRKHAEK